MIPGLLILCVVLWACGEAHKQWGRPGALAVAGAFVFALWLLGSVA